MNPPRRLLLVLLSILQSSMKLYASSKREREWVDDDGWSNLSMSQHTWYLYPHTHINACIDIFLLYEEFEYLIN